MKTIAVISRYVHLYVVLPLSQPGIIEEPRISLEYNVSGPIEKGEECFVIENDNCEGGDNVQKDKIEEGTTRLDEASNIEK